MWGYHPKLGNPFKNFTGTCKCRNSIGFWIFRSSVGFFHSGASRRGHADLGWGWSWLGSEGVQSWDGERWIEKKMGMSENPKIALASWELGKLELCYLPSLQKSCPCKKPMSNRSMFMWSQTYIMQVIPSNSKIFYATLCISILSEWRRVTPPLTGKFHMEFYGLSFSSCFSRLANQSLFMQFRIRYHKMIPWWHGMVWDSQGATPQATITFRGKSQNSKPSELETFKIALGPTPNHPI